MITNNLSTLKINKLTQEQYNRELEAGNIDANALYLTPEEQVQPDWNQNDPNAPDYIKNRTHYEDVSMQNIVTFDGNLEGYTVVDAYDGDFKLVKVSDETFTREDLIGQTAIFTYQDGSVVEHKIDENSFGELAFDSAMWVATNNFEPIAFIVKSS